MGEIHPKAPRPLLVVQSRQEFSPQRPKSRQLLPLRASAEQKTQVIDTRVLERFTARYHFDNRFSQTRAVGAAHGHVRFCGKNQRLGIAAVTTSTMW